MLCTDKEKEQVDKGVAEYQMGTWRYVPKDMRDYEYAVRRAQERREHWRKQADMLGIADYA